jgi:hypothetical protein
MWNQQLIFSPTFLGLNNLPNTSAFYHHICENLNAQSNVVWVLCIITQTIHVLYEPSAQFYAWEQSIGEIRSLVTDEPVEFEKKTVQDFRKITDRSGIIYRIYLELLEKTKRINMWPVRLGNTWISTDCVQNIPRNCLEGSSR